MGGFVTSFRRQGYLFDTVQLIPDSSDVLDYLGIDIELVKFNKTLTRIFLIDPVTQKCKIIDLPSGIDEFKNFLVDRYPDQKKAITHFFNYIKKAIQLRG